jgi:pyruvate dehydrogenase (quinone)
MATALGLQKAQPGRQVISLSGDGGIGMLIGDLMTAIQHKLPIKVAVFNNGKLSFSSGGIREIVASDLAR